MYSLRSSVLALFGTENSYQLSGFILLYAAALCAEKNLTPKYDRIADLGSRFALDILAIRLVRRRRLCLGLVVMSTERGTISS